MALCSITTGYYLVDSYKTYGQENGINDDFYFAKIGSIAAICNTIRFTWSTALDYFSYKFIYGSLVFIQMILMFTMPLVATNRLLYAIWVSLTLFCEGGHFTLLPNILRKIFGEQATFLYGILFFYSGVSSVLMIILQKIVDQDTVA